MDQMPFISCAVFFFVCLFPGGYRRTAFILFLAFVVNIALLPLYTYMVETDDLTVSFICGGIDAITAYFMLRYGGKYKRGQSLILIGAVMMNAVSLLTAPSINYNYIIFIMNLAQIILIAGGINGAIRRIFRSDTRSPIIWLQRIWLRGITIFRGHRITSHDIQMEEEEK